MAANAPPSAGVGMLWARTSDGHFRQLVLKPMSVAEFYVGLLAALRELGIDVMITTMPCEIADCIPFEQDTLHESAPHHSKAEVYSGVRGRQSRKTGVFHQR